MDEPIRKRLTAVEAAILAALQSADPEAVHNLRVALRRLRAALDLARPQTARRLDQAAHELLEAAGPARDGAVLLAWLDEQGAKRGRKARLRRQLQRELPALTGRLHLAMAAWRLQPHSATVELERRRAVRRFHRQVRKLERRMAGALADLTPRRAHRLRGLVRSVRYASETLAELGVTPPQKAMRRLAKLQKRLGDLQDAQVRLERLREQKGPQSECAPLLAERRKHQRLSQHFIGRLVERDALRSLRRLDD